MREAERRRHRLVADLVAHGHLDPAWREVFTAVPREAFVPDTIWRRDLDLDSPYDLVPVRRADDPERWDDLVHADDFVIIQVNDGLPPGPDGRGDTLTSSASMPRVVARMLGHLDLRPGQTVLEVGTGTGYNAALLAGRVGAAAVTTIEVDPDIAASARAALSGAGYDAVEVVTGDGADGYPPRAPYDRIIGTAAVRAVPPAWVAQTRPGGRIVTPWGTDYENGNLLALDVGDDGTAVGRLVDTASFMWLRAHRVAAPSIPVAAEDDDVVTSSTDLHPYRIAGHRDVCLAVGLRVPGCQYRYRPATGTDHEGTLWLLDPGTGSWASLRHHPDAAGPCSVRQHGPRLLFDEVAAAYRWWTGLGSPGAQQWQFVVDPDGQRVELPDEAGIESGHLTAGRRPAPRSARRRTPRVDRSRPTPAG